MKSNCAFLAQNGTHGRVNAPRAILADLERTTAFHGLVHVPDELQRKVKELSDRSDWIRFADSLTPALRHSLKLFTDSDGFFSDCPFEQALSPTPRFVPSPRLVGIELNPGPPKSSSEMSGRAMSIVKQAGIKGKNLDLVLDGLIGAGEQMGIALANRNIAKTKKKNKTKKSSGKSGITLNNLSSRDVTAPVARGRQSTNRAMSHKPFVLSGRTIMCYPIFDADGTIYTRNAAGVLSAAGTNCFNIDPSATSNNIFGFQIFPSVVQSIQESFTRYRITRFLIEYVPIDATTAGRTICFSVNPEVMETDKTFSFSDVMAEATNVSTPTWASTSLDALQSGGLRRDWLFLDKTNAYTAAETRQESPGTFAWALIGAFGVAESAREAGYFTLDYTIEFDGLCVANKYDSLHRRANDATTASSSSSSSSIPLTTLPPSSPSPDYLDCSNLTDSSVLARAIKKLQTSC